MKSKSKEKNLILDTLLLLLCLDLFGGRWITYIGIPGTPFFFIDSIFILICLYKIFFARKSNGKFSHELPVREKLVVWGLFTFCSFQILRNQEADIVYRVRDLIPFIYIMFIPFLRKLLAKVNLILIADKLTWTSIAHTLWAIPSARSLFNPIEIGGVFQEPLFGVRTDQTGFVLGVGILACFYRISQGYKPRASSFLIFYLACCVILLNGRAAFLAVLFCLLIGFLIIQNNRSNTQNSQRYLSVILIIFLFTTLSLVMNVLHVDLPEDSNLKRFGIVSSETGEGKISGDGTVQGRELAQKMLLEWTVNNENIMFGAGPGSEMLIESGAVKFLSGDLTVRSPHSWPIGLFSRFGVAGTILWFMSVILLLSHKIILAPIRIMTKFPESLVVPIFITSLFGVIIESPFGALPFAIFMAIIDSGDS
jgi:hypothetical protein